MKPIRVIVAMWLAWVLILLGFQAWIKARVELKYPDRALDWTTRYTGAGYQQGHPFLLEPFMNNQVAWDSEYYLAIAVGGYDDPRATQLPPRLAFKVGKSLSLSYAFFPLYPWIIRIFAWPLRLFGLNPIAAASLAGVIVSALGTLLGMLALYDLAHELLGEEDALRATFYLIIFPTGFFLLQVYTEGLFVGLAFSCLAMVRRNRWLAAAILAIGATLTRAVGVALILPMLMTWLRSNEWRQIYPERISWRPLVHGLLATAPLIAFAIWRVSYLGRMFHIIESNYFQRGFLSLKLSWEGWSEAFRTMLAGSIPQHTAYYMTEFLGLAIALAACIVCIKLYPELGWFSLAVVLISWGSGPPQGIHRYVLGAPAVFIALARWGRNPVFDRAWTILSLLLMGALAMLFAFDMWVA